MSLRHRLAASLRAAPEQSALVDVAAPLRLVEIGRRFWPRLRPLRGWLALGVLLLMAAPAIAVAEALLYQRLVDDVLVPAAFGPLLALALLYIGLNLLSGVVSGADDYLSTWVSQRFLVDLRRDVFSHVLALPSAVHDRRRLGDTLTRLTSDVSAVERFMVSQLSVGLGALIRLVFFVGALLWLEWQLALASFVIAPLFWWVSTRFARLTRDVSRERRRRGGSLGSVTEEALANASLVQSYGREDRAVATYDGHNRAIAGAELAASRIRAIFLPLVDLAELVGVLVVVGLGVLAAVHRPADPGRAARLPRAADAVLRPGPDAGRPHPLALLHQRRRRAGRGAARRAGRRRPPRRHPTARRAGCRLGARGVGHLPRRGSRRAARGVPRHRPRRGGRARRAERFGQDDARSVAHPPARRGRRRRPRGRPRRRGPHRSIGPRRGHRRPPGAADDGRECARQPRPRPSRRHPRGGPRGGACGGRPRLRRAPAARVRHPRRPARPEPLGRPATAARDRPRAAAPLPGAGARRAHHRARRRPRRDG